MVAMPEALMAATLGMACERALWSQPADSQERGMENSDHPQSRQTRMSGGGVMGG